MTRPTIRVHVWLGGACVVTSNGRIVYGPAPRGECELWAQALRNGARQEVTP